MIAQLTHAAPLPIGNGAGCCPIHPNLGNLRILSENFCDQPDCIIKSWIYFFNPIKNTFAINVVYIMNINSIIYF